MKTLGYMPLHYGRDFLRESLLSVLNFVDKFVILYSPRPSYGFQTGITCPDTEAALRAIAEPILKASGKPWIWERVAPQNEGAHREAALKHSQGFDLLLAIDADEVMDEKDLPEALETAYKGNARYYGVKGYIHLWRCFDYACTDEFQPIRITKLKIPGNSQACVQLRIWHFSCAQSAAIMNYKYEIHGHKNELRPAYLQNVFYKWTRENQISKLHPTSLQVWEKAMPYDKSQMPEYLKKHTFFEEKLIGGEFSAPPAPIPRPAPLRIRYRSFFK